MKEWNVIYNINGMHHCYTIEASNQIEAAEKAIRFIPWSSRDMVSDFRVERHYPEWN